VLCSQAAQLIVTGEKLAAYQQEQEAEVERFV
jgi:hypothetical protein